MITDDIIESLVNCKYKAYLKVKGEEGTKKEYELMQDELLESYKDKHTKNIELRYGGDSLIYDLNLEDVKRFRSIKFAVLPKIKTDKCDITFDLIKIIPSKFSDGTRSFVPILVSSKENFSKIEKLILCTKSIILSEVCNIGCEYARIFYGSELKTIKFKMEKFFMEAKRLLKELNKILDNEDEPVVFQKNHCKICQFQGKCYTKLKEEDSLALFRRVDDNEIKKYNAKGIFTVNQLSYTFKPRKRSRRMKNVISPYYLSLQALAIRENRVYVHYKIDLPKSKTKVFVDMEGNSTGSFIYLIGIVVDNGDQEINHSLWADNSEQEFQIFRKFVDLLKELDEPHIYYYGHYETKVFRRIVSLFKGNSIKELLEQKSTNVLKTIYRKIYFPTYSNGLKDIGNFLGIEWLGISSAIESVVLRYKWEKSINHEIKEKLICYNFDDCLALRKLVEFLFYLINKSNGDSNDEEIKNIGFVDDMVPAEEEKNIFKNMEYTTKDIEVITKCSYFEYQRNKIYFKSNKNFNKIIKRRNKQKEIGIKVNKVILIHAKKCPYCKSERIIGKEKYEYNTTILDLKIFRYGIKKWVIKYKTYYYRCKECKRRFFPRKYNQLRYYSRKSEVHRNYKRLNQIGWGHTLLAWIVHQIVSNRSSLRNLVLNLNYYFKIPLDFHQVWDIKIIASDYYKPTYENILRKLVEGNLIHVDESKIKLKNQCSYMWVFTNMEEVYYLYRSNREAEFLNSFLDGFNGVLISDFYSGYDSIDCPKQRCLIHLIRDLNDLLLKNLYDEEIKNLVYSFGELLRKIVETTHRHGLKSRFMNKHKKEVSLFFKKLKENKIKSEKAEKIQKRLLRYENQLFTFIDYDNVPWNNNNAEYSIKTYKDYLRLTKGTSTERGSEAHLLLLSIYQTCNYKGLNFLDFLLSRKKDIDEFENSLKK